jgi:hypothetical protein
LKEDCSGILKKGAGAYPSPDHLLVLRYDQILCIDPC